ncbi:MAG TPA: hypothetical protein VGD91_15345 [Trebonia sp.]
MFDEEWKPAEGELIDIRYGGKHGDWSGNGSVTANSVHYLMEVRPLPGTDPFRCECEPPSLMLPFKSPPFGVLVRWDASLLKESQIRQERPGYQQAGREEAGISDPGRYRQILAEDI